MASEDADENVNRGSGGPDAPSPAHGDPDAQDAQAAEDTRAAHGSAASADQPVDAKIAAAVAAAEAAGPANGGTVRIDSWIWAVRLIKTRSLGAAACRGGHVHVNGERVKAAHSLHIGDEVRLRHEGRERIVIVKHLIRKRVGAPVATQCYVDNSPPPPPREAIAPAGFRDRGAGRPTKRDRRELERLRGLAGPGSPRGFGALGGTMSPGGFAGLGGPGAPGGRGGPGPDDRSGSGPDGRSGSGPDSRGGSGADGHGGSRADGHGGSRGNGKRGGSGTGRRGGSTSGEHGGRPRGR
ncbi:RNA-binding S4 domain-containing protein [Streptomyces yokosukanensis]|uniref:RNA-binding S4 domain-containing protein n=1 Tax=Streptomyces yokosukanensis TaxID=67386 RepID=UPI00341A7C73